MILKKLTPLLAPIFIILLALFFRYPSMALPLSDDEWHSLFRVQEQGYRYIFTHFGRADHSIPFTLYNEWLSHHFVLTEWTMRLPILLCSLLFTLAAPLYLRSRIGAARALLFALLLATSPFLIYFGHIARPYSFALLFGYIALAAFIHYYRQRQHSKRAYGYAFVYALCAALTAWSLSISAFFVIAPFLYSLPTLFTSERQNFFNHFKTLLIPALMFTALFALLIGPPLWVSYQDLTSKAMAHHPTLHTYARLPHVWFGLASPWLAYPLLALSLYGLYHAARALLIVRIALLGCALLLFTIYLTRPAYSFITLTFARYLIFLLPLVLLGLSFALIQIVNKLERWMKPRGSHQAFATPLAPLLALLALAAVYFFNSTLYPRLFDRHYIANHNLYYIDPNPEHNIAHALMRDHFSDKAQFWLKLGQQTPPGSRVAVAPYYFESYFWFAPYWQKTADITVIPALVNSFCAAEHISGEPWYDARPRIDARSMIYLADLIYADAHTLNMHRIDWLVWFKTSQLSHYQDCNARMPSLFGAPDYEDDYFLAWKIKP